MFRKDLEDFILNLNDMYLLDENILCIDQKNAISYPENGSETCFKLEDNSFWFKHRNNCILEILKEFSSIDYFLDIGGGNGFVSAAIQSLGFNPILIEPSVVGVRNAKIRNINNIICASFDDIQWKMSSIPLIGLFDVLEHIEDDIEFLKKILFILKRDGYLFITVPAHRYLWSNEDEIAEHFRRYNLKNINKKLAAAGFTVKYSSYIFPFLSIPIFFFRSLPSFFGLRKKNQNFSLIEKEHKQKKGFIDKFLNTLFSYELKRISKKKKGYYGASCLIVAQKHISND